MRCENGNFSKICLKICFPATIYKLLWTLIWTLIDWSIGIDTPKLKLTLGDI